MRCLADGNRLRPAANGSALVGEGGGRVLYILLGIMVVTGIGAWITASRMRRKISGALGRKATDADLTSMTTWMQVAEVDRSKEEKKTQP